MDAALEWSVISKYIQKKNKPQPFQVTTPEWACKYQKEKDRELSLVALLLIWNNNKIPLMISASNENGHIQWMPLWSRASSQNK